MSTITTASAQWATRPADERFESLYAMGAKLGAARARSRQVVVPSRRVTVRPAQANELKGLEVVGPSGAAYAPTHWSFGQLATLAGAPAGYLRTLPAPMAADCLNFGLQVSRDAEDVGLLLRKDDDGATLPAATGPRYGRIWNSEIVDHLIDRFGDGVTGDWRVPGEFGKAVTVTKANTTLYAGDRDMFVFLADETNRIEVPNRRNGEAGSMARGFFVWNSEVGSQTFGFASFLFDYVCCNRIVWGAEGFQEIKMRHTVSAPDRFLDEIRPALKAYANASAKGIVEGIAVAKAARLEDKTESFLAERFGKRLVPALQQIHMLEEGRPIESLWDAATAATAYARSITWQDERVAVEREAGKLLALAA